MKNKFLSVLLFLMSFAVQAQDIKLMEFSAALKKQKIKTIHLHEVKYQNNQASDTLHKGIIAFDALGRIESSTEYSAGEKEAARFNYTYNEKGLLNSCVVKHKNVQFEPVSMLLKFDNKGHLIERRTSQPIPNFWAFEKHTYSPTGVLIKTEYWYDQKGTPVLQSSIDYPAVSTGKNLSFIIDQHGLPAVHQLFDNNGQVKRALKFVYSK